MTSVGQRRQNTTLVCDNCRRSHTSCDQQSPCFRCRALDLECTYTRDTEKRSLLSRQDLATRPPESVSSGGDQSSYTKANASQLASDRNSTQQKEAIAKNKRLVPSLATPSASFPDSVASFSGPPLGRRIRRAKHACASCQHWKIKCDGHKPCWQCTSKGLPCCYTPRNPLAKKLEALQKDLAEYQTELRSLRTTIMHLEETVTALYRAQVQQYWGCQEQINPFNNIQQVYPVLGSVDIHGSNWSAPGTALGNGYG